MRPSVSLRFERDRPTIGVLAGWQVHAGTPDSFLHEVFRGIQAAAQDQGCNLLLAYGIGAPRGVGLGRPSWPLLADEVDFVPIGAWNVDGLVIAPPIVVSGKGAQYFGALRDRGFPMVAAGSGLPGPAIVPDNEQGIRQAMAHLVAHGHQRIAFVAGHGQRVDSDSASRLQAYQAFVAEHDLEADPALVAHSAHTTTGGRQAMRQILNSGSTFTAVVASNDLAAVGAREVLREAGLRVPDDVALIGFDDRVEARAMEPQLTTVHYPIFEVGYQAVLLLLRYLDGQVTHSVTMRVPTRLVVRESCGCLPGEMRYLPVVTTETPAPQGMVETLTEAVFNETHRQSLNEVRLLCTRLVEACRESLRVGEADAFRRELQRILAEVAAHDDGLQGWQAGLSALRERLPTLRAAVVDAGEVVRLDEHATEAMLHQGRIAVNAMAQGQSARDTIRRADQAYELYQMTSSFQTAQEETEVFAALEAALPRVGIAHATVALYEAEGADTVAWSVLQASPPGSVGPARFATREFPPPGLYPADRPFHLALTPLLYQGQELVGFVAFDAGNLDLCADVTWLLASALYGLRLYRAAIEGRRLAEEANRLKGRFLSMVSHELRTPLNLISGLSDLLLRESAGELPDGDARLWEDLDRIYINAQHLDDLLRDVLDLARDEVGQLHLTCESLELREVLEPVAVIARLLAQEKALAWRSEIPDHLPLIRGDRTRLRQVLLNLVNNAIKFTERGEITLCVTVEPGWVRVAVRDTGLGIPRDEQPVIFDEFRQSERTTARGYGGLGLGLAICRRLIEMHGGEIGVHSSGEEGAGSEFYFTLPVTVPQDEGSAGEVDLEELQRIVLLVRDSAMGRTLQDEWLARGVEVVPQPIEPDGGWLHAVIGTAPSAVILAQEVAAERGWEVLNTLKQHPRTRRVPVLFLGADRDAGRASLLEVSFLSKPVGVDDLGEALIAQGLAIEVDESAAEKTVLIVDDDPESLALHTRIVQQQSPVYRVVQAHDGHEALDALRRVCPDLVLLDLMMPGLDGFGVLEAMRRPPLNCTAPVIILTGQTLTEEDMGRLNRGMVSVLSKGLFTDEETLRHLEHVLARRRRSASEAQRFVLRAMAYIHTHYMDPISRSDIAGHVGVSERHLTRCFRQEIGVSPTSYLNRYRVRQAKRLLDAGKLGITDVAMAVGFSSGGYFSRVFRQEMGVSPQGYQLGECIDPPDEELS